MRRPKDLPNSESWIDQQIREAQERGAFDDLPGSGKPLDLTSNPYARDRELAYKVLKDAGYAPEWIELDKAIREKLERARTALIRRWEWYTARLGELRGCSDRWAQVERERAQGSWSRAVVTFEREVETINKGIAELNLKVPSPQFQRPKVDAVREIGRVTGRLG